MFTSKVIVDIGDTNMVNETLAEQTQNIQGFITVAAFGDLSIANQQVSDFMSNKQSVESPLIMERHDEETIPWFMAKEDKEQL